MQIKVATNYDDVLIDGPFFFLLGGGAGGTKKKICVLGFFLTQEQNLYVLMICSFLGREGTKKDVLIRTIRV